MKKKPPKEKAAIPQEVIERAPVGWAEVQEKVASGAGLCGPAGGRLPASRPCCFKQQLDLPCLPIVPGVREIV